MLRKSRERDDWEVETRNDITHHDKTNHNKTGWSSDVNCSEDDQEKHTF